MLPPSGKKKTRTWLTDRKGTDGSTVLRDVHTGGTLQRIVIDPALPPAVIGNVCPLAKG